MIITKILRHMRLDVCQFITDQCSISKELSITQ